MLLGKRYPMTLAVLTATWSAVACKSHDPVPVSSCAQVVSHARKLLGDRAESWAKMNQRCQTASDQDRGCVMVADSAADILRCSM